MSVAETLTLPFFDESHRAFAADIKRWADATLASLPHDDVDAACRARVKALGDAGFLKAVVPAEFGGLHPALDVRTLCLAREILGYRDGLADFAFAMQGLGTGSISLFGSPELKAHYLPPVRDGRAIAAFALSEPEAGSDVAALAMTATPDGSGHIRLNGRKTWISNGGIADHYVVFARSGEAPGARGLSAFVVDAETPGFSIAERIETIAPHPLATLQFDQVRVPVSNRLGQPGEGFKVAMATLDIFRSTVGAAALGFARRALDEMLDRAASRKLFGAPLGDLQMTQAAIAESATEVDAAALLIYRAAWVKDLKKARVTREAAMAKMFATEMAQHVIDRAVQLFGGLGVTKGVKVEELYREIRALRIYEGATEVQKIVIAREMLKSRSSAGMLG
ncbi:MAG TPA: acyl-CoA dehydrogenase family protein [Xanthobacteraceae bacterium]|nr:acyl-CoA dehydrogenase family protein [Xanthobacteraceae bacterium]